MGATFTWMDIVYFAFLGLVIIGGITAIVILCPKENKLRAEKNNCYRLFNRQGRLILSDSQPSLFENRFGKPVYIEKGPFQIETFFDSIDGADGKNYRSGAIIQLYLPENGAETAANYLYSVLPDFNQTNICEALRQQIEPVFRKHMESYKSDADMEKFTEAYRTAVIEKLSVFGYDLYTRPNISIAENK